MWDCIWLVLFKAIFYFYAIIIRRERLFTFFPPKIITPHFEVYHLITYWYMQQLNYTVLRINYILYINSQIKLIAGNGLARIISHRYLCLLVAIIL